MNVQSNEIMIFIINDNFNVREMNKWINKIYNVGKKKPNLMEKFNLLMKVCYKNNIKVDNIDYKEGMSGL